MLALDFIKANRETVERAIRDKNVELDLDHLLALDSEVRAGIEWGVYGVPETYIVDRHGVEGRSHAVDVVLGSAAHERQPALACGDVATTAHGDVQHGDAPLGCRGRQVTHERGADGGVHRDGAARQGHRHLRAVGVRLREVVDDAGREVAVAGVGDQEPVVGVEGARGRLPGRGRRAGLRRRQRAGARHVADVQLEVLFLITLRGPVQRSLRAAGRDSQIEVRMLGDRPLGSRRETVHPDGR